jgi:type II restriction enzyme
MRSGTRNKGEWSEVYAALCIWHDSQIIGSTKDLEQDLGKRWAVDMVGVPGHLPGTKLLIKDNQLSVQQFGVSQIWLSEEANNEKNELLKKIKNARTTTFSLPKDSKILEVFNRCTNESPQTKADLVLSVYDALTDQFISRGFNVKSQLGARSSLLNASRRTNFRFKLTPASQDDIKGYSPRSCMPNKVSGFALEWISMDAQFKANLELIDSNLPRILSWLLVWYYQYGRNCSFLDATIQLEKENPLKVENPATYYSLKLQEFLIACGLGMSPGKPWKGNYEADGGYIIVKNDGALVAFYLIDAELKTRLGNYLLSKCFLDTPSTTRHGFGDVIREEPSDTSSIDLNLQIRLHEGL